MEFKDMATLFIATVGAVLGVLNAWRSWSTDRVKVQVLPAAAVGNNGDWFVSIEVRNLSAFALTIRAIGFLSVVRGQHMQIMEPSFTQGERIPVRLEPRTSCTALVPLGANKRALAKARRVYADTSCGRRVLGWSSAMRDIVEITAAEMPKE